MIIFTPPVVPHNLAKGQHEAYINEYQKKHNELNQGALKCVLTAWLYSITSVALTALAITAIAVAGAALTMSSGGMAFVVMGCIAIGAIGITASIVGGIWISSQGDQFIHSAKLLNQTLPLTFQSA